MRIRRAWDASFELLNNKAFLSRKTANHANMMQGKRKEIEVAQQRLLQKGRGDEELELSCRRRGGGTMCLQMEEDGPVNNMKVPSGVSEHWWFQKAFYMKDSAEVEKLKCLELISVDNCGHSF